MTLAIYTPARGRHHAMRRNIWTRLTAWWTNLTAPVFEGFEGAVAVRPDEPIFDAVIVADPLVDAHWTPEPGEEMSLIIGDQIAAEFQAEHKRPLDLTYAPSWAMSFTGYLKAIQPIDDEQKALPVGSGS